MTRLRQMRRARSSMSHSEVVNRYLRPFAPGARRYLTPRKLANAARAELDMRTRASRPGSLPYVLHVEPTNACTLRCPRCITGARDLQVPTGQMHLERYVELIERLKDVVIFARLDGVGEPTLNPALFEMIEHTHRLGVGTAISTNLQNLSPDQMERLVRSGLDYLIVSLDGLTQEVYEAYRIGGDIDKVYANLRAALAARRSLGQRAPFIEWQYLVFDHNAHQVDAARAAAAALGVDRFLVAEARTDRWQRAVSATRQRTCYWFYKSLNVSWTGDLKACCLDGLGEGFSMGNLFETPLPELWNGPTLTELRSLFVSASGYSDRLAGSKCVTRCPLTRAARRNVGLPPLPIPRSSGPTS